MKRKWIVLMLACAAVLSPRVGLAQTPYTITDLGKLGGESSWGGALNNLGQVLVRVSGASGETVYFVWDAATGARNLSSLVGDEYDVYDLNDGGEFLLRTYAGTEDRAFLWDGAGQSQYLGAFIPTCITNGPQVLGHVWTGAPHALVWDSAAGVRDIGSLPGGWWASGYAINNLGQVAGGANTSLQATGHPISHSMIDISVQHHAFLWDEAAGMADLGTLGGDFCWASALNDSGQVVGTSYTGSGREYRAFLWDEAGGMRDLGTLPGHDWSQAIAINNRGQVIGRSGRFGSAPGDACFLWDSVNGMHAIEDLLLGGSGWSYFDARDINDAGQIAGAGVTVTWVYDPVMHMDLPRSEAWALVLTPIPEPAGLAILVLGAAAAFFRRRAT